MTGKKWVSVTRAVAASTMACVAVLCLPTVSIAADPGESRAEAGDRASALLARGSGYGQPGDEAAVRTLQRRLRALGLRPGPVDGLYGPRTEAAVERFQHDSGVSVDGIVGPQTRRVLNAEAPPLTVGAGYRQAGGSRQVRDVQRRLRELGQRPGPVDGLYGPATRAAVERFQRRTGEPATGVLSSATATALARAGRDEQPARASSTRDSGDERRVRRTANATDDPGAATDEGGSTSPVLLALVALGLAGIATLLARAYARRRRPPEPDEAASVDEPSAGSTPAPSPVPVPRPRGTAAVGYVSRGAVDGPGLREQMTVIEAACAERGLELNEVVRDVEAYDIGSGRPGMRHALERLAAREPSCLVVAQLGELGGSVREVGHLVERLRRGSVRLVAVDVGLDTDSETGRRAADMLASLCTFDERWGAPSGDTLPAPQQRPADTVTGGRRRAAYDAPAVKGRIQAMRASGMSLQAIADCLNAENVPTLRGGREWRPSGVQTAAGYRRPNRDASRFRNGAGVNGGAGG
jgi:peptidoglycan hydrolase-like protein with peptidoglycan-binding domain